MIDLNPNHLGTVKAILAEHVPNCEVRAFGSRATWTAKDYSDLDLAVVGKGPLDWKTLGRLKEAFEESDLPMRVDVLDWHSISDSFRKVLEQDYAVLQDGVSVDGAIWQSEWPRVALTDLIDLQLSSVDKKSKANEQAVQLCNYMDVYNNSFIHAGMDFMPATATEREIARCSLAAGDVVITKDSEKHDDIGVPALVREDIPNLVCGYHLAILRPRVSVVDGAYLFYALSTDQAQEQFHSYANGITRFGLRKSDIGLVEIPLPPLSEQRSIAQVLGTLDDKIELNRRMNETLEAMARALFKSWFVDFEPVRAKMEGRWRRGESLPGLPAEHYDLFPDRLVPSELGEIPEGWDVKTLGELVELNPESWSRMNSPADVEYVDLANTKWGVIEITQHFLWQDAPSRARRVLRLGDTVVGTVRPGNGSYSLIGNDGLTGSTGFAVLRPLHLRFRELVYLSATASDNIEWLTHRADGAAYPAVRPEIVAETEVAIPTAETDVLDCFSKAAGSILDKMELTKTESRILAAHRDALLPGLVSGEVTVVEETGIRL